MTIWQHLAHPFMANGSRLLDLWYGFLIRFPVPSGDKWHVSLRLLQVQISGFSQIAEKRDGPGKGDAMVARSLHEAGRAWAERQLPLSATPLSHTGPVADTVMVVLKTLDLPSRVQTSPANIRVTTFRCPFWEEAKRTGEPGPVVCERTCGELKSLFKGLSEGFPSFVHYRAPKMMGRGADVCVKEFNMYEIGQVERPAVVVRAEEPDRID